MKIFEGKSPSERNKLIAAMTLGGMAILSLVYTFGGMFFGGKKTTVSVSVSPTATATASPGGNQTTSLRLPSEEIVNDAYTTTPINYVPGFFGAPDAGRNIFAFYEPAPPDPNATVEIKYTPTPTPIPATPTPTPPYELKYVSPQSVYAGSKNFRLEVNGDKFTPDAVIIWGGAQVPTNFVSPQKLTADIFANQIETEGERQIMVRSSDGSKYSLPVMLNVQPQPKPNFEYIGFRGRRQSNNDTATLQEANKPTAPPLDFRLNDVVGGRFRMVSISAAKVILEDTTLGFRHELPIVRPQGGTQTTDGRGNFNDRRVPGGRFPNNPTVVVPTYNPPTTVYNPTMPGNTQPPQSEIPGIPNNIPRYIPPTPQPQKPQQQQKQQKDDDDDDDDGDGR